MNSLGFLFLFMPLISLMMTMIIAMTLWVDGSDGDDVWPKLPKTAKIQSGAGEKRIDLLFVF